MKKFEVGKRYKFGTCTKRTEKTARFSGYDNRFIIKVNEQGVEYVSYTVRGWQEYRCYADSLL